MRTGNRPAPWAGPHANIAASDARKILRMDPKHLDLHMLRCLHALVSEAHVTRAAERMGMTQPAMSAALARLRSLFGDPLLVRTEKGMVPTPRAQEVAAAARSALELLDGALAPEAGFDPARSSERFEILASESASFVLMPALVARVRALAPRVELRIQVPDLTRARQVLEEGRADLLVSFTRSAPAGLRSRPLLQQELKIIAARHHPDVRGSLTLDQFLAWPHAIHMIGRTCSAVEAAANDALAPTGRQRSVGAWVPSSISSPAVVAATDFLATLPDFVARSFSHALGLQVLAPPLAMGDAQLSMYWHDRTHRHPAQRWLRKVLVEAAEHVQANFPRALWSGPASLTDGMA
jgi:DNA-binding transcriptional LysR family regulator